MISKCYALKQVNEAMQAMANLRVEKAVINLPSVSIAETMVTFG